MMSTPIGSQSRTAVNVLNGTAAHVTTLLPPTTAASPFNHSNWQHDTNSSSQGIQNSSVHWNITALKPNCLNCNYTTVSPYLITYTYSYSSDYAYYAVLLILLIAAVVCIKTGKSRRKEVKRRLDAQRTRARQQAESANVAASNGINNSSAIAKEFDLPPAYNEVVQSYISNEQLTQNTPTDDPSAITTNTISTNGSTLTIESELPNSNHASLNCLNNNTIV